VSVLTKKDWDQYGFDVLQSGIGTPKQAANESSLSTPASSSDQQGPSREFDAVKALSTDPDAGVRAAVQNYLATFAGKSVAADTVSESTDQIRLFRASGERAAPRSQPRHSRRSSGIRNGEGQTASN
jgi:hypothetical protein